MRWPDAEKLIADLIEDAGMPAALHEPKDFKEHLPFVHVGQVPDTAGLGTDEGASIARASIHQTTRIQCDVYAAGRDAAREAALWVADTITGRPVRTPGGLLDEVAIPPGGGPIPGVPQDDTTSLYHLTVVAQARPLP